MANGNDWIELIDGEILDCGTISINYQVNGIAQVSFIVYRLKEDGPPYNSGSPSFTMCAGGNDYKGWVLEQSLVPASEIEMNEWRITATAIACTRNDACEDPC